MEKLVLQKTLIQLMKEKRDKMKDIYQNYGKEEFARGYFVALEEVISIVENYNTHEKMSYHLIKDTTDTGFTSLCGLEIDKRAIGKERLVTKDISTVTCPMCKQLITLALQQTYSFSD